MLWLQRWRHPRARVIAFFSGIVAAGFALWLFWPALERPADRASLLRAPRPARILDRNDRLIGELFAEKTGDLAADNLPALMRDILLYAEDRSFYTHMGIDFMAVARATLVNLGSMSIRQGASTITQQTARILLGDRRRNLRRKLAEALLSLQLEARLSKNEILALYMNRVYLGHGAYGFQSAARFYFRKELGELNELECAVLAALPAGPARYSPHSSTDRSFERVRALLESMFSADGPLRGMDRAEIWRQLSEYYSSINRSPTETVFGDTGGALAGLREFIRGGLAGVVGERAIYQDGYTIRTTVDLDMQTIAEDESEKFIAQKRRETLATVAITDEEADQAAIWRKLRDARDGLRWSALSSVFALAGVLQGGPEAADAGERMLAANAALLAPAQATLQNAIVGLDPLTGDILFLKGQAGFSAANQFNRATHAYRQTGSSIKPFIYAAAMNAGQVYPATIMDDVPLFFDKPAGATTVKDWMPENIDKTYSGRVTAREALTRSLNMPAIQAAERAGTERVGKMFRGFFMPDGDIYAARYKPVLASAIGALEFSPLEMASAFSAFTGGGKIRAPRILRAVTDGDDREVEIPGGLLPLRVPSQREVMGEGVAATMLSMLRDSGRGSGVYYYYQGEMYGKTGTSSKNRDAWFLGSTPEITAAIWTGYDNPHYGMGLAGTGSVYATPLWGRIFRRIYSEVKITPRRLDGFFKETRQLPVCVATGYVAANGCPLVRYELYPKQSNPRRCSGAHVKSDFKLGGNDGD